MAEPAAAELSELLDAARDIACAAERPILAHYRRVVVRYKGDGSEVTDADREAETAMRELITRRFPEHGVLGEEFGEQRGNSWCWLLDPVDGTASFSLGVPAFGTLVGLLHDGRPVAGVMHFPALSETVYAARGLGCWFAVGDGSPLRVHVASAQPIGDAVVMAPAGMGAGTPAEREHVFLRLLRVMRYAKKFRFGGDCLQHAIVCRGLAHAAIDPVMHPWDIAALVPCVEEAGGVVSTVSGRTENVVFGGSLVSSCHPSLHREILDLLAAQDRSQSPSCV